MSPPSPFDRPLLRRRHWLMCLAGTALSPLAGCGGGTNVSGLSTGGTGSFSNGTVNGLGSIIVNGIRYDDSLAHVQHSDGSAATHAFQLGMVVTVEGSPVSGSISAGTATATATRISYDSEWIGPVDAIDLTASTFTLLGNTVNVSNTTVFAGAGVTQLAALNTAHWVEVYGYLNTATHALQATRVEVSADAPSRYKLSGLVARLGHDRCDLGALTLRYVQSQAADTLSEGMLVRAQFSTDPDGMGLWPVTQLQMLDQLLSDLAVSEAQEAELKGRITAYRSVTDFSVNGLSVDARGVAGVTTLGLTVGSSVEVEGVVSQGIVVASHVELLQEEDDDNASFELHGPLTALDTSAGTFVLRGYTLHCTDQTVFELDGASWAVGLRVEVEAQHRHGRWYALKVEAS